MIPEANFKEADFKIEKLNEEFQKLVKYVTDENSKTLTAHEVESYLFENLLKLGKDVLGLFFFKEEQ
jgi:ABC-type Zn uptake system ZnuABC Zn-binding protein ZnuA